MLGLADGLARAGVDLAAAGLLAGTSAGACVATNVATGSVAEASELQRRPSAEIVVPFAIDEFLAAIERAREQEPSEAAALVRIAAMDPLGPDIGEARRREVIAARLPRREWPGRPLVINAIDAGTGEWVRLRRESGVGLVEPSPPAARCPGSGHRL